MTDMNADRDSLFRTVALETIPTFNDNTRPMSCVAASTEFG